MTITLEIPVGMEAQLCERAAKRGQAVTDYMMTLAESEDYFSIYEWESEADHQEAIALVEQGLEELHAGDKGMLLEDYLAQVTATRNVQPEAKPETKKSLLPQHEQLRGNVGNPASSHRAARHK